MLSLCIVINSSSSPCFFVLLCLNFPTCCSSAPMIVSYTCVLFCISWSQTSVPSWFSSTATLFSISLIFRSYISSRIFERFFTLWIILFFFSHALTLLQNLYLLLSIVWISFLAFLQYSPLFFRIGLNPLLCWSCSWEFLFLLFFGCFRNQMVNIYCYLK